MTKFHITESGAVQADSRFAAALRRHRHALAGGVVAVLLGTAVTAFGVAPLTQTEALPPIEEVTVAVTPADLSTQLDLLSDHALQLQRSELTRSGDTADSLLSRLGLQDRELADFLRNNPVARQIFEGRVRKLVTAEVVTDGVGQQAVQSLVVRGPVPATEANDHAFQRITISRESDGFYALAEEVPMEVTRRVVSGKVQSTLFGAADAAGLPDGATVQLAELFGTDIDFRRDLRRGDTFSVVYESLSADGEPPAWSDGAGRILAARFVNRGKPYEAVWFQEPGRRGQFYDFEGRSTAHIFLASPLAFSRVTSGFAMRFHPLLRSWRQHAGVDYGAPTGTPVRTVGDGEVVFAGRQGGYGNVVQVRHTGQRETFYAHLSRIDVRVGQKLDQGAVVGAVGATGWATGPHLHFEFRVNGAQVDPMTIARASETATVPSAARQRFKETASLALAQLQTVDPQHQMALAHGE
jgi:murein DD-endopeptidase MepM/ murein hydrolase activator NlpD